jgi:hypothetical protein
MYANYDEMYQIAKQRMEEMQRQAAIERQTRAAHGAQPRLSERLVKVYATLLSLLA